MKIMIFIVLLALPVFSQTENVRWEKAEISYRSMDLSISRDYSYHSGNPFDILLKTVTNAYWFFFSDLDGENCPFHPSCSSFLLDAVEETNIVQGTFMFFDRFSRDASFIGRYERYPKHITGKLYDPAHIYDLNRYQYIPASKVVDAE